MALAVALLSAGLILASGCERRPKATPQPATTQAAAANAAPASSDELQPLAKARKGFKTHLIKRIVDGTPAPAPPGKLFRVVQYEASVGKLTAYLTSDPADGARHPAIVWITGGDCNSIGDVWTDAGPANDQTAAAYRQAGIIMMFPSLRGGNDNPGQEEGFLGEVDDVLAAADFLAKQAYVDPHRIYLGGHSSGGTLALLVSECSARGFGRRNQVSNTHRFPL
jgi:acetyl esterase/lipase